MLFIALINHNWGFTSTRPNGIIDKTANVLVLLDRPIIYTD